MNICRLRMNLIAAAVATALPAAAFGADDTATLRQEIEQLKKELSELRAVVQQQKQATATKADVKAVQTQVSQVAKDQSEFGRNTSGVHLAGYGHVGYSDQKGVGGSFSEVGFNPIFHYHYKDLLLFETELEAQANAEGEADIGLEYANLNLFVNDYVTVFGGKFLSPIGYFIQNLHPAWINRFPSKPPGFQEEGGAALTSDIGLGVRGAFPLGAAAKANYTLYVGNGPRIGLNEDGDGIESIVATGGTSNPAKRKLVGGRIGIQPIPGLELGLSGGTSRVAVDLDGMVEPSRSYSAAGGDFSYQWKGLDLRGEYIQQKVGDLAGSVAPLGGTWKARYLQVAYRFTASGWEPVVRYGKVNTPNDDQYQKQWGLGLNYWFAPNIVGKLAYEINDGHAGTPANDDRVLLQFAYGF